MRFKRKSVRNTVCLAALIVLMILGGISLKFGTARDMTAADATPKIARLFGSMDILGVTHIDSPMDLSLLDLNGKNVRLSNFRGKIVFLNFWTTWCPDCRIEMPSMEALHQRFKDKDFVMVAVNLQEPAARVQEFFKKNRLTFAALLDTKGEAGIQFAVRAIPATFILNRAGSIIGRAYGARKWDSDAAMALFEYLTSQ